MEGVEQIKPLDISEQFITMSIVDFLEFVRTVRNEPHLAINVDLSQISDKFKFQSQARRLKAFLDSSSGEQKRDASIKCSKEQVSWEPNVFSSGVKKILIKLI